MATIKLQNGKVILKDGKVSCECCESCSFDFPPENYFLATIEEYNNWRKGGIATVSASINFIECNLSINEEIVIPKRSCIVGVNKFGSECNSETESTVPYIEINFGIFKSLVDNSNRILFELFSTCPSSEFGCGAFDVFFSMYPTDPENPISQDIGTFIAFGRTYYISAEIGFALEGLNFSGSISFTPNE